jgi:hypothetical protein
MNNYFQLRSCNFWKWRACEVADAEQRYIVGIVKAVDWKKILRDYYYY